MRRVSSCPNRPIKSQLRRMGLSPVCWLLAGAGLALAGATPALGDGGAQGPQAPTVAPAVATAPAVDAQAFEEVGSSSAILTAQINPGGLPTSYRFEYGTSTSYGAATATAKLPAGAEDVSVSAQVNGLQPETIYYFRVLASSEDGVVHGSAVTFTTLPTAILGLPDGRGYEMVSPLVNADGNVYEPYIPFGGALGEGNATERPFQAAEDGNAVTYVADAPASGGNGEIGGSFGNQYFAVRNPAGGWTSTDIQPSSERFSEESIYEAFSADLSVGIVSWKGRTTPGGGGPGSNYHSLYAYHNEDGSFDPIFDSTPPNRESEEFGAPGLHIGGESENPLVFAGASSDYEHILFIANDALTPEATDGGYSENNLYEETGGQLHLVNVLPDGSPRPNAVFGGPPTGPVPGNGNKNPAAFEHDISTDGSRIFWSALNEEGQPQALYVRENSGSPESPLNAEGRCTVAADACTVQVDAAVGGGGQFWTASADGSKVFFTKGDLYEYDLESGATIDLTPGGGAAGVLGASEDGSYLYVAAKGAFAPGTTPQACEYSAESGCNLYELHEGEAPRFVALLTGRDGEDRSGGGFLSFGDWSAGVGIRTAEVTPDGRHLAFLSERSITGYDNAGRRELYVYDAQTGALTCVSCESSGEPPRSLVEPSVSYSNTYLSHWLSDEGNRVFFETRDALVPQDTNGLFDVYEWDRDGTGSCTRTGGCVYLLSGGTSLDNSLLTDASANGHDVFIVTRAQLVPQDQNDDFDLYDVRIGVAQLPVAPQCVGSGCQGVPPAPPIFATPSSVTFDGVGNFPPPAETAVKAKAKTKPLTRAQKLAKALKACKTKSRGMRARCKAQARRRYGHDKNTKKGDRGGRK
jgi:hypothetical protein